MKKQSFASVLFVLTVLCNLNSFGQANKSLSNLTSPTAVNKALLPGTDSTLSLGSGTLKWKSLYISNAVLLKNVLALYAPGTNNFFVGKNAGNQALTGQANTGIGTQSLRGITSGSYNTGSGYQSLYLNTAGLYNSALGYQALYSNTTSDFNTASGYQALYANTGSAYDNTANGYQALYANSSGSRNTSTGVWSLLYNTAGNNNVANGVYALLSNGIGSDNTAVGYNALYSNSSGYSNVALGSNALYTQNSGSYGSNTIAIGDSALYNTNNVFYWNTAVGSKALYNSTTAGDNTAIGYHALYSTTTGGDNTAIGQAMYSNTTGNINVAIGYNALASNTTGTNNVAVGNATLYSNVTGNYNSAIGILATINTDGLSNSTALGYAATATASNQVVLGNSSITSVIAGTGYVIYSDGRFKKNIKQNVPGLEFINLLNPVTYNYDIHGLTAKISPATAKQNSATADKTSAVSPIMEKAMNDKEKKVYTGLIAQDVEAAAEKLNYDFSGVYKPQSDKDIYGLSYSEFIMPLIKSVQQLSQQNTDLQNQINALKTTISATSQNSQSVTLSDASLAQNVPNPFKNNTIISYNLPQNFSAAQIIILDKNGTVLKQVNVSNPGRGTLTLDASTLSSGAYSYSLMVDGKMIGTKQMVLTK
jgi:acetyltransferase-like isoleucine patch superfamily enzyme